MNTWILAVCVTAYLLLLAWVANRIQGKERLSHPFVAILALGTYGSLFGLHTSLEMAYDSGFGFLAYYLGISGAFLLAPMLMYPIYRVSQRYQLFSLPDLLAFRFKSQTVGSIATLCSVLGVLMLLALNFRLITDLTAYSSNEVPTLPERLLFPALVALVSIFLIARQYRYRTPWLIGALASDTFLRLLLLLSLGVYLLIDQFGSPVGLDDWIEENGQRISAIERHLEDDPWRGLLLLFFGAPLICPPIFHLLFSEKSRSQTLFKASWGAPLLFLLMSLPIPIILWSSIRLSTPVSPELYVIGMTQQVATPLLSALTAILLLGSGLLFCILANISVSSMSVNHLMLPWSRPEEKQNIYEWLRRARTGLMAGIPLLAWLLSESLPHSAPVSDWMMAAFSLLMQVLPGTLALIYWPQGNRFGFISGFLLGSLVWLILLGLPLLLSIDLLFESGLVNQPLNPWQDWHLYLLASLFLNTLVFAGLSLVTPTRPEEVAASHACSIDSFLENERTELATHRIADIRKRLEETLGKVAAGKELEKAMSRLEIGPDEHRPIVLKRLRQQLEINLSALLGPATARRLIRQALDMPVADQRDTEDRYLLETQLEDYHSRLTGLAAELDSLRRYHRQILHQLPMAACTLNAQNEVMMWNQSMAQLTRVDIDEILGAPLTVLPDPWSRLLQEFAASNQPRESKKPVYVSGKARWYNLNKARLEDQESAANGWIILVEDCTDTQRLERELAHSERLASIGQLAAGVAHEIGNPITGIACLAQNLKLADDQNEVLDTAGQIKEQTDRVSRILDTLMNFSRSGNMSSPLFLEAVDLRTCADQAIQLIALDREARQVSLINEISEGLRVLGDPQRLSQVFVNLLNNARDACSDDDRITLSSSVDKGYVYIDITDTGDGIPGADLQRIFEPFYTTKRPGKGTGLGLSLVYGIIEEHNGNIRVSSPPRGASKGTCVSLEFPLATDPSVSGNDENQSTEHQAD